MILCGWSGRSRSTGTWSFRILRWLFVVDTSVWDIVDFFRILIHPEARSERLRSGNAPTRLDASRSRLATVVLYLTNPEVVFTCREGNQIMMTPIAFESCNVEHISRDVQSCLLFYCSVIFLNDAVTVIESEDGTQELVMTPHLHPHFIQITTVRNCDCPPSLVLLFIGVRPKQRGTPHSDGRSRIRNLDDSVCSPLDPSRSVQPGKAIARGHPWNSRSDA